MATNNFFSFFSGGTKSRELRETRASWERVEREWRTSPLATLAVEDLAAEIVSEAMEAMERIPAPPVVAALGDATEALLRAETLSELEPLWGVIENNVEAAIEFREMLGRRSRWATQYKEMHGVFSARLGGAYREFLNALPEACFATWDDDANDTFDTPLIDLIDEPATLIERLIHFPFTDDALTLNLFSELRKYLRPNILNASGISLTDTARTREPAIVPPTAQKGKSARELAELYLDGTPFAALLELPIPFKVAEEVRFEHCHVIGGTGHGKTQFLQKMIYADLIASQYDKRSVVVIDSQGDLIQKLAHLELFSPHVGGGLGERLVLIDPSDIDHPAALNLFDAHLKRVGEYDPVDRERVLNGVVELYETFFDALLGAELTARQDVVFRYLARLMITIPGATIHTLMEIMERGQAFAPYMEKLEGSAKRFFETEFFSPSFSATKSQILKRLWGVLSTPAFERMFSQRENKLDLFAALNDGSIILVNTAKDLLKEEGSRLFGRFFIAMLAQAALERSTVPEAKRTPTFVYVDEAHEYFDDRIEAILNQARKYRVGLTLSHQNLDQLSTRLRSALLTNTSMKCAGGVSAKDARTLADELHTTPEFIDGMRRRGPKTEFAVWVKHQTPHAIRVSVPLGFLERQHTLDEEDYDLLLAANRARYGGTRTDVMPHLPLVSETDEMNGQTLTPSERTSASEQPSLGGAPLTRDASQAPRVFAPFPSDAMPPSTHTPVARELGKGGPRHRYLQSLVKELAEQQGLKATIEGVVPGGTGQVDVLLERGGVIAAVEISVTTPAHWERVNVLKCLRANVPRVALLLAKSKRSSERYKSDVLEGLSSDEQAKVSFLAPEDVPDFIASLAPTPEPKAAIVKGYRVSVSQSSTSPEETKARREALGRIIARSMERRKG